MAPSTTPQLQPYAYRLATAVVITAFSTAAWSQDAGFGPPTQTDADASDSSVNPDGDAESQTPPAVIVPELVQPAPPAPYPAPALAAGVEGVVPLILTIDSEGEVVDVQPLATLGHGLDEAAQAAALQLRFSPARRNGQPVATRIRYEHVFELPKASAPEPPVARPHATQQSAAAGTATVINAPAQDVTVRGQSAAQRLRASAEAVSVIETKQAQRESADLGEVVARNVGISLRRTGGLGSGARFCLNGLCDQQVRFFIDGIPLDVAGYGLGIQNVPVNFVERVEVYRGVVPIRFGNDALAGAVNLVTTEDPRGTRAIASAQLGSFGTLRLTGSLRHVHEPTGRYASADVFRDQADNDYEVNVDVPDDKGRLSPARVRRFHDAYAAYGGRVEIGLVRRAWAKRLSLRLYGTRADKELQNNIVMSVPYGEANYWDATRGALLQYEQPRLFGSGFGVNVALSVSRRTTHFEDLSPFVYDWFGRRIRDRVRRGELGEPSDERIWEDTGVGRLLVSYVPSPSHAFRLAISPTIADRSGRDLLITMGRDPLSADRHYLTLVSGIEHQGDLFARRLETITFGKSYVLDTSSEEPLPGGIFRRLDQHSHTLGFGEAVRLRINRFLWAKASYERATRLPTTSELFGNGVLILPNLRLVPELSHNGNISLTLDLQKTRAGAFRGEVNLFLRHVRNQIVLLGNDMVFSHQNVYTTRSQGVESNAGWTSPGKFLALDANVTWQDLRNASDSGAFRDFKGDRLPNQPYLFANLSAHVQASGVSAPRDTLSLGYHLRYVNSFFRGWESLGLREFKQVIPDQTTQTLLLTYAVEGAISQTWTAEIQNFTNARTYDFFGVQRPGRAFFVKVTAAY